MCALTGSCILVARKLASFVSCHTLLKLTHLMIYFIDAKNKLKVKEQKKKDLITQEKYDAKED